MNKMINLRKANPSEAEEILKFYELIIDSVKGSDFNPKWNSQYPNLEFITSSIANEELYIYKENDRIISSVIVNNEFSDEYDNVRWIVNETAEKNTAIHTFAVHPEFSGRGIGEKIFETIKNNVTENNQKSIRIDVIDGNIGAQKVFEKLGFEYVDSVEYYHDAVGLSKFHLYEYALKK